MTKTRDIETKTYFRVACQTKNYRKFSKHGCGPNILTCSHSERELSKSSRQLLSKPGRGFDSVKLIFQACPDIFQNLKEITTNRIIVKTIQEYQ